ncbi:unnamed protein product [Boreogadus saida]
MAARAGLKPGQSVRLCRVTVELQLCGSLWNACPSWATRFQKWAAAAQRQQGGRKQAACSKGFRIDVGA